MKNSYKLLGLIFDNKEIPKIIPTIISDKNSFKSENTISFNQILSFENMSDFINLTSKYSINDNICIDVDFNIKHYETLEKFYAKRLLQSISIIKSVKNLNVSIYSTNHNFNKNINSFYN